MSKKTVKHRNRDGAMSGYTPKDRNSIILKWDHPALSTVCEAVPHELHKSVDKVIQKMKEALWDSGNGVGLAANQIGAMERIIIIWPYRRERTVMINPEITKYRDEMVEMDESCLSYPGKVKRISRYYEIHVSYMGEDGSIGSEWFTGMPARIIQHEIDHLDGKCKVAGEGK